VADRPSFWRILCKQLWQMVKIITSLCLWAALIWRLFYPNAMLMSLSLSGSLLVFMVVRSAWSDYKCEKQGWIRELREKESEERKVDVPRG
jgi:hypothetical protein